MISRKYALAVFAAAIVLTSWLAARVPFLAPSANASAQSSSEVRFDFGAPYYRVSEEVGVVTVTVVRSGDTARTASVEYLASNGYLLAKGCGYLTWVGTATPDTDYARASGRLNFAAGETTKTFEVTVTDDALIESRNPETVFLSLDFSHEAPENGTACYGAVSTIYIHDNDPASPPAPPPTPTGKRQIAFTTNRDGNFEVYTMDEDGGNPRRLTNDLGGDGHPSWSPDGKRIAFVSNRDGKSGVYLMNADGTNVTKLASGVEGPSEPEWSPDGTRIAFVGWRQNFSSEIFVVNLDGSNLVNVTNNPGEDFGHSWSPDSKRLAITSRRDNGTFSVFVVNAEGSGTARRLVEGYSRDPVWSPDGTRIAYTAEGEQTGLDIYVVNADGTNKKMLSGERPFTFDSNPSWSSDGAKIAFASNRDGNPGNYEIYVMNADGTGQTRLTNNSAHEADPSYQPTSAGPPASPTLLTEANSNWAIALDSVTFVLDPFSVTNTFNFSPDRRTRVALFAAGVDSPADAGISVRAEDAAGGTYQLPVEYAGQVPGHDWLTQVVVRLPDELDGLDYVWVSLNVRGTITNKAVITLRKK